MRRVLCRLAVATTVVFGLSVVAPVGAVRDPELPVSWMWSWLAQRPAWAKPSPAVPHQQRGRGLPAGAADTTAHRGAGRAARPAAGTLPAYQPHDPTAGTRRTRDSDPGFDPKTSNRDPDKSSARSDIFTNADGSATKRTYSRPVNFRAKDGSWQPIDPDLEKRSDGRLHMAANSLDASVAGAPSNPAARSLAAADATPQLLANLTLPTGESVGYSLSGANPVSPTVQGSTATYAGILPETDLELRTFDSGIKETLILRSPQAPSSWTFPLTLTGLTAYPTATGSIELRNAAGKAVAFLPHGFMQDAKVDPHSGAPAESAAVTFRIIDQNGTPALQVDADPAWLHDPARVFPVRVDPTTTTATTGDVFVDNDSSTTGNGDNLPVGTYDGGATKARSFIHLDDFDNDGLTGKRITKAQLKLYLTWAINCAPNQPFEVRRATEKWTVADLTNSAWPGPAYSVPMGSLNVTDPGPACTNTAAVRSVGKWVTVPLFVSTFNDWSSGGANNGLALTASESVSAAWKRFTSANYDGGTYKPVLELTYTNNVAPQVDVRYPANNAVVPTLTPELLVKGHDSDAYPNKGLTYTYTVLSADGATTIATSPAVTSAWTVPAGKLAWNTTYLYTVKASDKVSSSTASSSYAFTVSVPEPTLTANLAQNGGKGFDASIGNYTTSATDANVATVGPSLAITRSYNSLDPRRDTAFGVGWSSILDTKATQVTDVGGVQAVRITYPTGEEVAFGRTSTGTFVAPSGRFSTLAETKTGSTLTGYKLTDKDSTVYTFGRALTGGTVFRLTSITDANGRTLTIDFATAGNPTTVTSASGRKLTVAWSTPTGSTAPHVSAIVTDPATAGNPASANTWTYGYGADDQLSTVCQPDSQTQCWRYGYESARMQQSAVLNLGPESYWPLSETSGTIAASPVLSNAGMDKSVYRNATLNLPGVLGSPNAPSAGFNGTSSSLLLPSGLIADGQYQSVSMWFTTTTPGGVLFSYSGSQLSAGTTTGNYTPALYIDKFGKLRGELWNGAATPIQSNTVVTDGKWHHVVLAGAGDSQTLYVDGVAKGTLAGTIRSFVEDAAEIINVGAGFVGGTWPDHANSGLVLGKATYFNGSISDVGFFNQTLSGDQAAMLNTTGRTAQPVLTTVTRPSGGRTATVAYDKVTGKVASVVDENGGTWTLAEPKVAGSSLVYAGAVLGGKPADYFRLGDSDVADAVNEVAGGDATYSSVTLGSAGPFADATAAQFNGTSSYLELPSQDVPKAGPSTVEMWFKLPAGNAKGGVLYGYQIPAIDETSSGGWVPALYVGTDGKLRGGLWANSTTPMVAPTAVNDGKWHHVALTSVPNAQVIYLDGKPVVASDKAVVDFGAVHAYVGTGRWSGAWTGRTTEIGWWPGQIAEFAYYATALNGSQVADHVDKGAQTAPVAMTMISNVAKAIPMPVSQIVVTTPTGNTQVSSYDLVNGNRLVAQTDELGNTTKYGYDVGGYASMVYDPKGALTQTLQDVRGNTKQSITCQDQSANKCSSVYFTYFPDATTKILTPNPKNDLLLTTRDGRSSGETDDRYLTSNGYDDKGNLTVVTDPLKHLTRTAYTAASSVAADGGVPPAGLPAKVSTPGGATQSVAYLTSGDVAQVTEPDGKITKFTYDGLGQVLTETEITAGYPAGLVTTHTYDPMGREVTETDPPSTNRVTGAVHTQVSTTTYDIDGNPLQVSDSDATGGDTARVEKHTYNGYGQEITSTTPGGATTQFSYDTAGRLVDQTSPDGVRTHSTYDAGGNLVASTLLGYTGDPNHPETARNLDVATYTYDEVGQLKTETDPLNYVTTHEYTDNGLELTQTRWDGPTSFVIEENTYDEAGNVVQEKSNNGKTVIAHTYDAAGRETTTVADPAGLKRTTSLGYDDDDRQVSQTQKDASGTVMSKMETLFDSSGNPLSETTYLSDKLTPVGRWKLADGSGLRAADSAGNSPATATGGVTFDAGHGGAANFAGTNALATAGPVVDTARSFTVSAWLKLTNKTALQKAVSAGGDQQTSFDLSYDKDADRWRFAVVGEDVADTATGTRVLSTSVPAIGAWTQVTGVYDAVAGTASIYVGGTAESTKPAEPFAGTGPVLIGAGMYNGSRGNYWAGGISDVQLYQQAVTAAQATDIGGGATPAADAKIIRSSAAYDQDGHVTASTDPNGNTGYASYDEDGNPVKTVAPAAPVETTTQGSTLANAVTWSGYNTFGEQTDDKDANGNWSVTYYDADGRPTIARRPSYTAPGSTTAVTSETLRAYNASGQLASVTDPFGKLTSYEYDQLDRPSKVTAADGGVTTFTYNADGDLASTTDPTGAVTGSTWDYLGRQLTSTDVVRQDATADTTNYTYGTDGQLAESKSPTGVLSAMTYNPLGDPVTVKDGAGNITTTAYDGAGRPARTTMADLTYSTTTYDLAGRAVKTAAYNAANTLLQSTGTEYDATGNVVATVDGRKTRTTFEYDATGLLVKEKQPINASEVLETSFGYDIEGNQTRFTDGRGNGFFTTYNSWGLPESQVEPATAGHPAAADRTFVVVYDKAGQPVKQTLPGGVTVTNSYDAMGQLKAQAGAGAEAATADRSFDYDLGGRMTKFSGDQGTNTVSYDDRDLPLSITGPSGNSSFSYTGDGDLASRTDAAGTTSYKYDTAGRLGQLINTAKGLDQRYTYDKLSAVQKIAFGTGSSRNLSYDELHRLTGDELKSSAGTSIAKIDYGWNDNDDLVSKKTVNFGGATTANTYDYDLADRLTSWNNGTNTTVYAYDKSGNRVQNGNKLFTYDARNRLLTADGAGYSYTARGTLSAAGAAQTKSDAFGQVVSQGTVAGANTQTYRYDGLGRVIRDGFSYTGSGNDLAADATSTYVRGTAGEVVAESAGAVTRLAWTDMHDDVVGQFTAAGATLDASAVYDPLGKVVASTGVLVGALGYQSEWTDTSTERVNMMARWYNANTGQFDTRDTVSNSPVPDSVGANRYQYGDANPLTVTDPSGHWGLGNFLKKAASAVSSSFSSAVSYTSSYVSSAYRYTASSYHRAASAVKSTYHRAKKAVKKAVHAVKKRVHRYASSVKRHYKKAVAKIKKKATKWVKAAYHKAAKFTKAVVKKAKQAGKATLAVAKRVAKNPVGAIKDAAKSTAKFVVEHKDALLEIAAIGGAILAGLACTAVTAGVGAIACMVGAGALINLAKDAAQGDIHSVGDALGSMGTGALSGLAGGAGGAIAGKLGTVLAGKVGTGVLGRLATDAVENGVDDVINQAATTGRVDPRSAALGMIPGLGMLARKSKGAGKGGLVSAVGLGLVGAGGGGAGCGGARRHSFDPDTRVLMADGTQRPIKDVNVGDKVKATDPVSGVSKVEGVTQLHRNTDRDLSKVTVKNENGRTSVLNTTQNHPFWNETNKNWTDAKDLKPGDRLKVAGRGKVLVTAVVNRTGTTEMRDLTVAELHTYYVITGNTPVLVHNCTLNGSGPRAGVLEVSDRVKSVAAVKNFSPKEQRDFVWDPATGRFATGADQGALGHDGLRTAIGASEDTVIGGNILRGPNGQLVTNEWSGHYGHRWNDQTRTQFVDFMKSHGVRVDHQTWGS